MTKLFIAYAQADMEIVSKVSAELEQAGYDVWTNAGGIQVWDLWVDEITSAIIDCDIFLLFISPQSVISDYVRRELEIAFENGKKTLLLQLEKIAIPASWRYQLVGIRNIDYRSSNWKSELLIALGHSFANHDGLSQTISTRTGRLLNVFLCHSSNDKPVVRKLYGQLSSENWIDPWLDEEKLLPGENWDLEIKKAVKTADVVIVCLSRESVNKEGYLQKEIKHVLDIADEKPEGTIFVIPLKLDSCDVPYRLSAWQWVNYYEEGAYNRLLLALRKRARALDIESGQ